MLTTAADYPDGRSPNVATVRPDGTGRTVISTMPFRPRGTDWSSRPTS